MGIVLLEGVQKKYQGIFALKDITLEIGAGEWIAIMGPSGSGKSTLLNLIGCLDKPTSGRITLGGLELTGLRDNQLNEIRREKIGLIFQEFHLIAYLTAVENIMVAQYYHSMADEFEAIAALEQVGLKERVRHFPGQLSGGEQQRVCIARALINQPNLILADEPTGNLDEENEEIVMEIFTKLHRQGHTIIMVTHNPELGKLADKQIYLEHGKVVAVPVSACNFTEYEDEVLEALWCLGEEGKNTKEELLKRIAIADEPFLEYLSKAGMIKIEDEKISFTENGSMKARDLIRRHRLAEVLMFKTFHIEKTKVDKEACQFEHILSEEVTDKICTFLGHPKNCPHGEDIPFGECCKRNISNIL